MIGREISANCKMLLSGALCSVEAQYLLWAAIFFRFMRPGLRQLKVRRLAQPKIFGSRQRGQIKQAFGARWKRSRRNISFECSKAPTASSMDRQAQLKYSIFTRVRFERA